MRICLGLLLIFTFSCGNRYKGFESFSENVHYKLTKLGDDESSIENDDYVLFSYSFCSSSDCNDETAFMLSGCRADELSSFFSLFHLGDEAVLLLDSTADDAWLKLLGLEYKSVTWPLIVRVGVRAILGPEYQKGEEEDVDILRELREVNAIQEMTKKGDYREIRGCFVKIMVAGNGDTVKPSSMVHLSYKAYLSDGQKFDDTHEWKDTLRIIYGQPFQIIPGLEIGIEGMTEGSEAKIIIPSHLAFGKQGSPVAGVPPHEPLLYDLKIEAVTNN